MGSPWVLDWGALPGDWTLQAGRGASQHHGEQSCSPGASPSLAVVGRKSEEGPLGNNPLLIFIERGGYVSNMFTYAWKDKIKSDDVLGDL